MAETSSIGSRRVRGETGTIGVAICSYRRPDALAQCLQGLSAQTRRPDDVMVISRREDCATLNMLRDRPDDGLKLRVVPVERPGLVAARNAALAANKSDVVVFCDDDTIAHADWVERILGHFQSDRALGGLGGRDRCHDGEAFDEEQRRIVGRIQWFGRIIGNHHRGFGAPRQVHFLKGANMSYHAEAIAGLRFDERLRGRGAQPHDDLGFSLAVRRTGWKLLYDPAVLLDHYAFRGDQPRNYVATASLTDPEGYYDSCYNLALVLQNNLNLITFSRYLIWSFLVGIRSNPGLGQCIRLSMRGERDTFRKFALFQRALWSVCCSALWSVIGPPDTKLRRPECR